MNFSEGLRTSEKPYEVHRDPKRFRQLLKISGMFFKFQEISTLQRISTLKLAFELQRSHTKFIAILRTLDDFYKTYASPAKFREVLQTSIDFNTTENFYEPQ